MIAAPSLIELRQTLERKQAALVGILFAPPYTHVGRETLVPRLGYLDARAGQHVHFFCAGYGGYRFAEDARPIAEMQYDNGVTIPWGFSERRFAAFVSELEAATTWRYSGEADLILLSADLEFSEAIVFDLEAMLRDGAAASAAGLLEAVIAFARDQKASPSIGSLSDHQGTRRFGAATIEGLLGLIPEAFRGLWRQGTHYRVRDLTRG